MRRFRGKNIAVRWAQALGLLLALLFSPAMLSFETQQRSVKGLKQYDEVNSMAEALLDATDITAKSDPPVDEDGADDEHETAKPFPGWLHRLDGYSVFSFWLPITQPPHKEHWSEACLPQRAKPPCVHLYTCMNA